MPERYKYIGLTGLILTLLGLISAVFFSYVKWYSFFVIGGTLLFGYINLALGNESILKLSRKNPQNIPQTYLAYLFAAVIIELIGRFTLRLWSYPSLSPVDQLVHIYLVGYPFAFFMIYETWILIKTKIRQPHIAIILTTLLSAFIHEIPNTFAFEWKYTIPFITFEIMNVNLAIIIAWSFLVSIPLFVKQFIQT